MAAATDTHLPQEEAKNREKERELRIWIDTEFNEFGGQLISMGLTAEDGKEFYEVLHCPSPAPWVAENVMPILGQFPIPRAKLQIKLQAFLRQFTSVHLIADWPEDIAHFCNALIIGPGQRLNTPTLTMEIRRDLDADSRVPHHALWDARAIKEKHLNLECV